MKWEAINDEHIGKTVRVPNVVGAVIGKVRRTGNPNVGLPWQYVLDTRNNSFYLSGDCPVDVIDGTERDALLEQIRQANIVVMNLTHQVKALEKEMEKS